MKVLSLFSGAGGFDLGLIKAGHEIIWAIDNDRDCCSTYSQNINNYIIHDDIGNISLGNIPKSDVVIGGFPCQGFSLANLHRSVSDERNKLYKAFVKVIKKNKPKYFIAENVRGILSLANGLVIKEIISDFEKCGYSINYKIINAADYGVPQNRIRVFIIGVRKNLNKEFLWPEKIIKNDNNRITIAEALKNIPEPTEFHQLKNHIGSKYKVTNRNFTGHRKTDPNKPSPTILARGNGKGGVCAIIHPSNHRRMTVREQAIIQTFPMNFEFIGKIGSMYRQVGNAVPVKMAYYLGMALIKTELQ